MTFLCAQALPNGASSDWVGLVAVHHLGTPLLWQRWRSHRRYLGWLLCTALMSSQPPPPPLSGRGRWRSPLKCPPGSHGRASKRPRTSRSAGTGTPGGPVERAAAKSGGRRPPWPSREPSEDPSEDPSDPPPSPPRDPVVEPEGAACEVMVARLDDAPDAACGSRTTIVRCTMCDRHICFDHRSRCAIEECHFWVCLECRDVHSAQCAYRYPPPTVTSEYGDERARRWEYRCGFSGCRHGWHARCSECGVGRCRQRHLSYCAWCNRDFCDELQGCWVDHHLRCPARRADPDPDRLQRGQ